MRKPKILRTVITCACLALIAAAALPLSAAGHTRSPAAFTRSWYFAEGTTAYGFEEYVCIQNPTALDATVRLTCMFPDERGQSVGQPFVIEPQSRATVNVASVAPDTDVSVKVDADKDVICERSMYWGSRIEGHNSLGIMVPMTVWYLAEGCTNYGFEEYVSLQNPSSSAASVNITYNTSSGPVPRPTIPLPANSRRTIRVNDDIPPDDVSVTVNASKPIVAERSMYWDQRRGGHDSIGTDSPARDWFLAEGSTKWGFDTYVLVQNPSAADAAVNIDFLTEKGAVDGPTLLVKAGSRQTVDARATVGAADFSTRVSANRPIVCERSMYWNNGSGKAGHDTIGVKQTSFTWDMAEGSTAYGFETFVLIANPSAVEVEVNVTYMTPTGIEPRPPVTVPPYSRVTIDVNKDLPGRDVSIRLEAWQDKIAAERAMYWSARSGGHDSIGYANP